MPPTLEEQRPGRRFETSLEFTPESANVTETVTEYAQPTALSVPSSEAIRQVLDRP
jgi:hypothetical protein